MSRDALAFVFENSNKQTISVLIGALETDPRFDELDIHLLRPKSGLSEQVEALAVRYDNVVGHSFTTLKAREVFELVGQMRDYLRDRRLGNVTLIAARPPPSGDPRQTLNMAFDVVVVGEGEKSLPALLAALFDGMDPGQIRGLAYQMLLWWLSCCLG